MLLEKIFISIDRARNQQRKLQINKNYAPSYSPDDGEFENLCFVSITWTVSVSCVFVYNVVDMKKLLPLSWGLFL